MTMENTGTADAERTREYSSQRSGAPSGSGAREGQSPRTFGSVREDTSYVSHNNPVTGAVNFDRRFWGSGSNYPQIIMKLREYVPQGYKEVGTATLVIPREYSRVESLFDEYYDRARFEAQYVHGYRHTPIAVTSADIMWGMLGAYVPAVANIRTALEMPSLFEYNDGFRTLRKNFVTASKVRRLISLHEQFESIPMPNHWRNQAVAMAGLFSEREGGTPVITFYDHPAHDAHGETYTSLETALAAETAHGVDVAATLWTTIITNAETAIKVLRGAATTAAWNTDVMNWLDLWRMVNVPRGLPERPRTGMIRVNEFMVANRLKFSAIAAKHTPTGADKMGFYPKVSTDTEAVIRPWVGTPDEWWWSGMTDMLAWYAAGDSLGTLVGHKIGTLLPISAAPTEGADSSRWYTLEDGWQSQIWSDDMDDNAKIQAVLSAPDLKSHVWSTVPASLPGATNYADLDVSSYGSGYVGKVEQDLRDVADGFYKKMVLALEFAVA